jgi:hypothetical protein
MSRETPSKDQGERRVSRDIAEFAVTAFVGMILLVGLLATLVRGEMIGFVIGYGVCLLVAVRVVQDNEFRRERDE